MKKSIFLFGAVMAGAVFAAAPQASVTSVVQGADRTVTVSYALLNPPAIVTFSAETNGPAGWAPMDGKCVSTVQGDVFRKVTGSSGSFRWNVDRFGIDGAIASGDLRIVLTAWRVWDPPDYMTVSIAKGAVSAADRVRWYTSTNELPGGLLENTAYRMSKVVMRRIHARGVPWTMGSSGSEGGRDATSEASHPAMLTNDYYIGVFPMTVAQMSAILDQPYVGRFYSERPMRICDRMWYMSGTATPVLRDAEWPAPPAESSVLGKLRTLTAGVIDDWDLPTEGEWEFACRAGTIGTRWGNGTQYNFTDSNRSDAGLPGRYRYNQESEWGTSADAAHDQPASNGTPIAGSYAPNLFGLYDMHGGVWEYCLDWYQANITALGGAVNICPTDGSKCADGVTAGSQRVIRGGSYLSTASACRSARRSNTGPRYAGDYMDIGVRLSCRAGLR